MYQVHQIERLRFHQLYNNWLIDIATDNDKEALETAQDLYAPRDRVSSMLTFIRACMADQERRKALPPSLAQHLRRHQWPKVFCIAS